MNFSNLWNRICSNPRTSIAGVLIGAATICGVLSQQGITLGNAGTGTVVALIAGLCTALLGLLARDPASQQVSQPASQQKKLGAWMLIALLLLGTMPIVATTGCQSSQVINEINVVLNEADAVLAVADPGAPWLPQLKSSIAALEAAESTWQNGGAVTLVEDALNTIAAVTAVIPQTAAYAPLIDVLVAGISAVLAALPQPASARVTATLMSNPHAGRYKLVNHWYHSPAGNLKANWNAVAKQHGLLQMAIK